MYKFKHTLDLASTIPRPSSYNTMFIYTYIGTTYVLQLGL